MWLFDDSEFRDWLAERNDRVPSDDLSATAPQRCVTCGSELKSIPHSEYQTCGFCLAFEFGYDIHGDRLASVVKGIGDILASGDRESFRRFYRQLLEDLTAALYLPLGPGGR